MPMPTPVNLNHFAKKRADFTMGVASLEQLPEMVLPEVAFAGRSNVGKSSLLNAMVGRTHLARTSETPGRTQQLNYFNIDDLFHVVDMPGYGYAKASKKAIAEWNKLVRQYLAGRANLARVFVLIDARRGITQIDEHTMMMLDEAAVSYQLVLTKADKISSTEMETLLAETTQKTKAHGACHPDIIQTSAHKARGLDDLRLAVLQAVLPKAEEVLYS